MSERVYRTTAAERATAKARRDRLRDQKRCINGAKHPEPAPGLKKCWLCLEVHRGDRAPNAARRSA